MTWIEKLVLTVAIIISTMDWPLFLTITIFVVAVIALFWMGMHP